MVERYFQTALHIQIDMHCIYVLCNVLLAWHCKITIMYVFNTDTL